MGILEQLDYPTFKVTKSDQILIEYINQTKDTVIYKSISEIAKESALGEATITRFTKKLGYSGFQEFKITLAKELSIQEEKNIVHPSISRFEDVYETADKLLKTTYDVLQQTVEKIDGSIIAECIKAITKGNKIYIIGIGHSGITASDFNYKLMRIGLNTICINDSHTMIMMASIMQKEDVILAISHSGQTKEMIESVKIAKEQGASIISLTENKPNELKNISDMPLTYQSDESFLETGSLHSKISQVFILDLIYAEIFKNQFEKSFSRKIRTTDAIMQYKNNL